MADVAKPNPVDKLHPVAKLNQVSKCFRDGEQYHQVLQAVDLQIHRGETVALTGPSGSGKSTLLNLIAGFEMPDSGEILLEQASTLTWQDKDWSRFRRNSLGVVFQQFNLLTPLNVKDNIAFSLSLTAQPWAAWCDYLVEKLGLMPLLHRQVEALSGGQQQRVAIARALAHKPTLLLADEPTGNLDDVSGKQVMALLCELARESQTSILMVTHSEECAAFMQKRWHLSQGAVAIYEQ
ncbi:ABC transporter ATP-binding protein [Shewanella baltica]|uniref:ABC transporter ATP-binding protein n=1 Tax=Shewanella baltica TaxID=62322 RepID=UPI00217E8E6A|nr:ABC transporter ATP-binding protein [Shewanella baltica]MCS6234120.1 ABC transporter ATP-binding protein [Shewanella baltica]MCS6272432.1 ABC transporter ATP-binding protein [Shewanella baltica]MDR9766699.1 ABC transporter ATP-binding protein [Shewanella baltica]